MVPPVIPPARSSHRTSRATWGRDDVVVGAWVAVLVGLLLGPALLPGYVLTYDMVWVPDLVLTRDALGLGTGLPRAVPSDAVVAVLDEVVPGMVLQKLVLVGSLLAGGLGTARLLPPGLVLARLVASAAYVWNPLVVERLVIGHWPLLVAYGVAPWLLLAVRRWSGSGAAPARLWLLVPLASLAASSGITTAVLLLAAAGRRGRWRLLAGLLAAANLPWVVAGLLHAGSATSDPGAAARFALQDEGRVPGPVAALTLGGTWNSEVVPDSRTGLLGWLVPVLLLALAAAGVRALRDDLGRRLWWALVGCWVVGWAGASLTWLAPDVVGQVAGAVPGGGVLRDGARLLVLCAPLLCLAVGRGAVVVATSLPAPARVGAGLGLLALPVALLPGVAWGAGAGLRAVSYPADLAAARSVVRALEDRPPAVLLPFSSYRAPAWNGGRKVLDPTGRYLGVEVVQSDVLLVDGVALAGEDPRVRAVSRALAQPTPDARSRALARLGVGLAVVEQAAGSAPAVTGAPLHTGDDVMVLRLPGPAPSAGVAWWWWPAMLGAWAAYVAGLVRGVVGVVAGARRERRGRRD